MSGVQLRIGLREANQDFGRAIRAVRAGRTVLLTDRGRPLAILRPVRARREEDAGREELVARGLMQKAVRGGAMGAFRPVRLGGKSIAATIRSEREARR